MSKDTQFSTYTDPPEDDLLYLTPEERRAEEGIETSNLETYTSLDDEDTRSKLEAKMIQTFLGIMEDRQSAPTHRLSAAKEIGELLGKYAKAATSPTIGTQNNQTNILDDPDKRQALVDGLKKARSITDGTDSGTRPLEGGKGV